MSAATWLAVFLEFDRWLQDEREKWWQRQAVRCSALVGAGWNAEVCMRRGCVTHAHANPPPRSTLGSCSDSQRYGSG